MSIRRACGVLVAVGVPAVLTVAGAGVAAPKDQAPAAKPRPAGAERQVRRAVRIAPAMAADPNAGGPGFTDAITFPTDRKAYRSLDVARDFIAEGAWGEAARVLQTLLDAKEDVTVPVKGADGNRVSIRLEANRMLGSMPAKGREFYELQYGARAKARLAEAKKTGDLHALVDVASRYRHTAAGAEALNLLGTYCLDRGEFGNAAQYFDQLLSHDKADRSPPALLKALIAFRRAKDAPGKARADQLWQELVKAAPEGVPLGGRAVPLDEIKKEVERFGGEEAPASVYDWPLYMGAPSRSAQGVGGAPFLEVRWTRPTIRESQTEKNVAAAIKQQETFHQPVLPAFFPVAATIRTDKGPKALLIYRSYWGIHALDLARDGALEWESSCYWSLDKIFEDQQKGFQVNQWLPTYVQASPGFLIENSTVGTLSTDNNRVYIVDDLALPPHPQTQPLQQLQWGGQGVSFGALQDAVYHNRLEAFELSTGKIKWELGGRGAAAGELADSYFLGPPLPADGKLYVLTEHNGELRLVCLEPSPDENQPPRVAWVQGLANFRDKLLMDPARRIQAAHLAYGDGILVCPTNAGAILGIDPRSRSLAWAYSYREDTGGPDPKAPNAGGIMMRGGGVWMGQAMQRPLTSDWKTSAPVVQDGKVVFTGPDARSVHCISLRDGRLLWKEARGDDLYLGGVYSGRVILVGRSSCRALDLNDGKRLWRVETGMPSGQGVASNNVYYLPLRSGPTREPEVCAIDMARGIAVGHTKSRKKEVPGNLLFYEGSVISQDATSVTGFPQLDVVLAQTDQALRKNPDDPVGLTNRGELRLDKGDLAGAVEDLRRALGSRPKEDVLARARTKLFEALTEMFQRDFNTASERYLEEYKDLCRVTPPAGAGDEDRQKAEEEQRRRQANFLCLVAKGREQQGRLLDAFQAYVDFAALPHNQELVSVIDEPAVKARPDVWAQGRIAAMLARATPDQRRPLEEVIAARWRAARQSNELDALRQFVALFGTMSVAGQEARFTLAERLADANNLVEAELQLLQLRAQADPPQAARAVEALARLMIRKGLLEDAAHWYRVLGRDYARVVVRDGKTGAELYADLAADKRFLPYLDVQPGAWPPNARFKVREVQDGGNAMQAFALEPEGDRLPFFDRHRLGIAGGALLKVTDRATGEDQWTEQLGGRGGVSYPWVGYPGTNMRYVYHACGHLVVCTLGSMTYGIDPVGRKKLWEHNLLGTATQQQQQILPDRNGGLLIVFADGYVHHLGDVGAVSATSVCLYTRDGLVALDPLTGAVLWRRNDVTGGGRVFGDGEHVYLAESRADGGTGGGRAFRARDGAAVDLPADFAPAYANRLRVLGRQILLATPDPKQGNRLTLRLYDVQTGQDVWKRVFAAGAVVLQSEDPDLAGVAEPAAGGKVTAVDLRTGHDVLVVRVDPKDLDKVQSAHLLRDDEQLYVALYRTPENQNNQVFVGMYGNVSGMRSVMVNGKVYAFRLGSGKLNWYAQVPNLGLVLEQFKDVPVLFFTAQYHRFVNQAGGRGNIERGAQVRCIDKRTGKLLMDRDFRGNRVYQFYALASNPRAGTIDLLGYGMKVQAYLDDGTPRPAAGNAALGRPGGAAGAAAARVEQRRRIIRQQLLPPPAQP